MLSYRSKTLLRKWRLKMIKHNLKSGENIKRMRTRLGLTQKELGEKIGISARRIGTWEQGAVLPTDDNKQKLEKFFYSGEFSKKIEDDLIKIENDLLRTDSGYAFTIINKIGIISVLFAVLFAVALYFAVQELLFA